MNDVFIDSLFIVLFIHTYAHRIKLEHNKDYKMRNKRIIDKLYN